MRKFKLLLMLAVMSMSVAMQAMQIFVNIPGGTKETLEMEPSDSFENMKAKLEDKTDIPMDNQSLFYNGVLMLDGDELWQKGITSSGHTLDLVVASNVYTSLSWGTVIKLGDKLNLTPGEYSTFGVSGQSFPYANCPYTLIRGNIDDTDPTDWVVTEATDGAYYIFKGANGNLYAMDKMAVSSNTDGLECTNVIDMMGSMSYILDLHVRIEEFSDNADGIEAGLAALVGQTVNIEIQRTFYKDGYFNTICLPFSLDETALGSSGYLGWAEIFEFESAQVNGGTLDLYINQVYAIEAGKPYLVRWANDPWNPTLNRMSFTGVEIEASEGVAVGTGVQFVGSMGKTQLENGNENYLFVGANNTLYWPNTDNKLKGFRAYFKVSGDVAPHGAPARMVIRNTPTAVENTQDSEISVKKVLRDGQLMIIRNGMEYNANGQAVK